MALASPQLVRRIQNNLSDSGETYPARHGSIDRGSLPINGASLQPKQTNWEPAIARGPTNRSGDSGVSSPGDVPRDERRQRKSHVYEDVDRKSRPQVRHSYEPVDLDSGTSAVPDSRTSSWVTTHTEINWGRNRESSGSMWAPHNRPRRPQRQESFEREREIAGNYHSSINARSYSQRSPHNSHTLPAPGSPIQRRVSYMSAMGDGTADRIAPTSYTASRHSQNTPHKQPRNYDSLQRLPPSTSSSRRPRRGSESGRSFDRSEVERFEETKAMLLHNVPTKLSPVHRTRSYGGSRRGSSGEGITRTASGRMVGQGKQSLL